MGKTANHGPMPAGDEFDRFIVRIRHDSVLKRATYSRCAPIRTVLAVASVRSAGLYYRPLRLAQNVHLQQ